MGRGFRSFEKALAAASGIGSSLAFLDLSGTRQPDGGGDLAFSPVTPSPLLCNLVRREINSVSSRAINPDWDF